jgi:hypothetical protein
VRRPLCVLLALALSLPPAFPAAPGDRDGKPSAEAGSEADRIPPEHQEAIERGLRWLALQQLPNGAFPTVPARGEGNSTSADYRTAVTALATLAFLGAGHGLRHGPYRDEVRMAVDWLLKAQAESGIPGYVSAPGDNQSRMHGHGFATLALAEAYGTAASPGGGEGGDRARDEREFSRRLHDGIQRAVDLAEDSQSTTGGWDYVPSSGGTSSHEGSITVCQVQALLAARNRGFRVRSEKVEKARRYMRESQAGVGGFRYRLSHEASGNGETYSWALTAAGVVSLLGLAEYDRKDAIERGVAYMERRGRRLRDDTPPYFFYGSFYAVQAYHWLGGERWERYWIPMRSRLLDMQEADGSWTGHDTNLDLGDVYPTAFCLLMLEVPVGYLSIYAR